MREAQKRQLAILSGVVLFGAPLLGAETPSKELAELHALESRTSHTDKEIAPLVNRYEQLVRTQPKNVEIRVATAAALWRLGRNEQSMAHWEAAATLAPNSAPIASQLGECHLWNGTIAQAAEYFRRAVKLAPTEAQYHFQLALVYFTFRETANLDRALHHFRRAAQLNPTRAEYLRSYAETFSAFHSPDWREALSAWLMYLGAASEKDYAYSQLARVCLRLGRRAEAEAWLERITDPGYERVKTRLRAQTRATK